MTRRGRDGDSEKARQLLECLRAIERDGDSVLTTTTLSRAYEKKLIGIRPREGGLGFTRCLTARGREVLTDLLKQAAVDVLGG